jgi:carbon-monoxide dehydrogenase large subunit
VRVPSACAVAFVRSPHAHARIESIDAGAARRLPGVVAVVTADDLRGRVTPLAPRLEAPGFRPTAWPALADGEVRFAGQAVAAVVAETAYLAADAREHVVVSYAPLPPAPAEVLFTHEFSAGDVDGGFARAAVVVRETFRHARCSASPLEPRGVIARVTGDALEVWASTQTPHLLRDALAAHLGLPPARVRVIVPDVGGGFGQKLHVFPEDLAVAAVARLTGRAVKWVEERRENLAAASHAREQAVEIEAAASADGFVLALRARLTSDAGAYHIHPLTQAVEPLGTATILPGPYRVPAYAFTLTAVSSPKPPLGAYRGVGMVMAAFVMERTLDLIAARLGLDPAEIRRHNLIPRGAYPYRSAAGLTYDSGDYPAALARALELAGYDELRREQARARAAGRRLGVGLSCYTEYTGMGSDTYRRRGMVEIAGHESATLALEPDGRIGVLASSPSQGQGHATALAQLVADHLGVPIDRVVIAPVDTASAPPGSGTFASRGAVCFAGSVPVAAEMLRRKILSTAAGLLEASADDLVLEAGMVGVRGVPGGGVSLAQVAESAPGLEATAQTDPPGPTFSGAVHVAVVEVDPETGRVAIRKYVVVEDCGPVINPLIVDGQIHGAVAQGVGEALYEALVYDGEGQLLTATLMDYALPVASCVPSFVIGHLETPSPLTPGGVKGMGEGGTIGAPAAIANAVADAVRDLGVTITRLPIRPQDLVGR